MERRIYQSYLAFINNSVWSGSYRQFFVDNGERIYDVMDDGDKSCAYFVSSVLKLFNYSKEWHATIDATLKDMIESGWHEIPDSVNIPPWSIIVWAENMESSWHRHIGFFVWSDQAVSNSSKERKIRKHEKDFGGERNIFAIYGYNFNEK